MRMLRVIFIFVALTVAFAACGGNDDDDPQATATITASSPTPTPTPCAVTDADTETKSTESNVAPAPVTDVKYTAEGCPRITFEFDAQAPGYLVEYASEPFSECGSGEEVSTDTWDADAFLRVRLEPSASVDLSGDLDPTYDGPRDIDVGGDVLKHMKVVCDFEAVFEWIVGLDDRHDFSVRVLAQPTRLVLDISESA